MASLDWAKRRQRMIEIFLTLCGVGIVAVVAIAVLYKAPSCMDGKQNQGETGIDCGGPCPYLCSVDESAPRVSFVRAISPQPGRSDIIAYVDNTNADASTQAAKYTVEVYGQNQKIIATKSGTLNLPPSSTVPLFIPAAYVGKDQVTAAFITFDPQTLLWIRNTTRPSLPIPANIAILAGSAPKITATISNPSSTTFYNETVVATVFDAQNNAIAASQTVIPILPGLGSSPVVFTWNQPFTSKPVRVEILPSLQI